jgi:hypothetical protein
MSRADARVGLSEAAEGFLRYPASSRVVLRSLCKLQRFEASRV